MKADVEQYLIQEGFDVDVTGHGRGYGDGRIWVLPSSFDIVGLYTLEVVCAVVPGGDIETFADRVFSAFERNPGMDPVSIIFTYGQEPISGREQSPADTADITVNIGARFGDA